MCRVDICTPTRIIWLGAPLLEPMSITVSAPTWLTVLNNRSGALVVAPLLWFIPSPGPTPAQLAFLVFFGFRSAVLNVMRLAGLTEFLTRSPAATESARV